MSRKSNSAQEKADPKNMTDQADAAKVRGHLENMPATCQQDSDELTGISIWSGLEIRSHYMAVFENKMKSGGILEDNLK